MEYINSQANIHKQTNTSTNKEMLKVVHNKSYMQHKRGFLGTIKSEEQINIKRLMLN